jgi:hypothetical protein
MDVITSLVAVGIVLIVLFVLSRKGKQNSTTLAVYKPEAYAYQLDRAKPVRPVEQVKVQGTPETIVAYLLCGFLTLLGVLSWGDQRPLSVLFLGCAGFLLFVHFSWPYFWAKNPPRDAEEMAQDRNEYKNRNAWSLFVLLLLGYLVLRAILNIPSNRLF